MCKIKRVSDAEKWIRMHSSVGSYPVDKWVSVPALVSIHAQVNTKKTNNIMLTDTITLINSTACGRGLFQAL